MEPERDRPLSHRVAAGLVLAALLAAGAVSSCWILQDRADFGSGAAAEDRELPE